MRAANRHVPLIDRFHMQYEPVPESGCWIWTGAATGSGYGRICDGGKGLSAHRLSYELHHRPLVKGEQVCHKCDVPACVNPDHLYAGTHSDNMRDKHRRGRANQPRGERIGSAKLTADAVAEIKQRLSKGADLNALSSEYGVAVTTLSCIKTGRSWRHIAV